MYVEYDWRDLPVSFKFYDRIVDAVADLNPDQAWRFFDQTQTGNGAVLLSEVRMVYDAAGNRVQKKSYAGEVQ